MTLFSQATLCPAHRRRAPLAAAPPALAPPAPADPALVRLAAVTWAPTGAVDFAGVLGRRRPVARRRLPRSRRTTAPIRRALTLVELLVVIAVLVTLVVGVIPVLSPNNDQRKIREAARELHTFIQQAQAQAARTGRPTGIAFAESGPASGTAADVFFVAQPPAYGGFGQDATLEVLVDENALAAALQSGPVGEVPVLMRFGRGLGASFVPAATEYEAFPPKLLRLGDVIRCGGHLFQITRGSATRTFDASGADDNYGLASFVVPASGPTINARWINNQTLVVDPDQKLLLPSGGTRYLVERQPTPSTGAPLQFPSGIGIDLDGSGFEAIPYPPDPTRNPPRFGFRSLISQFYTQLGGGGQALPFSAGADEDFAAQHLSGIRQGVQVSVMFAPEGHVSAVYVNGEPQNLGESRIYLLVGRLENALPNVGTSYSDTDVIEYPASMTDAELEVERTKNNWLDLDSRWVTVARQSGRAVVSENAFVDPRTVFDGSDPRATRAGRIQLARQFAREMRRSGGS